jgi:hypothetical protein
MKTSTAIAAAAAPASRACALTVVPMSGSVLAKPEIGARCSPSIAIEIAVIRNEVRNRFGQLSEEHLELAVTYVVGAYMSLLISWLDAGARVRPECLDTTFRRLSTAGLQPFANIEV